MLAAYSFGGDMDLWEIGQYVKLHTDDEWNDLYGIILDICEEEKIIVVFCVTMPCYKYYVPMDAADNILELFE